MTIQEIHQIFGDTELLQYDHRRFAFREGLRLLFDLDEEHDEVRFDYDEMWYCDLDDVIDKITPEQCKYLAERGWFISEGSFNFSN